MQLQSKQTLVERENRIKDGGNARFSRFYLAFPPIVRPWVPSVSPCHSTGVSLRWRKRPVEPKQQALTFGFSFPTLLGLLPTVVLIIALATVGKESPGLSSTTSFPGDVSPLLQLTPGNPGLHRRDLFPRVS